MSDTIRAAAVALALLAAAWPQAGVAQTTGAKELVRERLGAAQAAKAAKTAEEAKAATRPAGHGIRFTVVPVKPALARSYRARAEDWGRQTRLHIVRRMHLVETRHFLIFSAWNPSEDKALAGVCERMYEALCRQFSVPRGVNIWTVRFPIFMFWDARNYRQFTTRIDEAELVDAGGYHATQADGFSYVVMNRVYVKGMPLSAARTRFMEVLVHETTHAFLARYRTRRRLPVWVDEGLAEYMAAELVPGCSAVQKHGWAAAKAIRERIDVSSVFGEVRLKNIDYGIAQSLVRFLNGESVAKGPRQAAERRRHHNAFVRFLTLLKDGRGEEQALGTAYGSTHAQLLRAWYAAQQKSRAPRPEAQP